MWLATFLRAEIGDSVTEVFSKKDASHVFEVASENIARSVPTGMLARLLAFERAESIIGRESKQKI